VPTTTSAISSSGIQRAAEAGADDGLRGKALQAASTAAAARRAPAPLAASTSSWVAESGRRATNPPETGGQFPRGCAQDAGNSMGSAAIRRISCGGTLGRGVWTGRRPAPAEPLDGAGQRLLGRRGLKPSSRAALAWVTHIFFRAMRTASSGTRGGLPVRPAQAVLHARRNTPPGRAGGWWAPFFR
jgi:hypothetical protein